MTRLSDKPAVTPPEKEVTPTRREAPEGRHPSRPDRYFNKMPRLALPDAAPHFLQDKLRLMRDFLDYEHAGRSFADVRDECQALFKRFLEATVNGRCLRVLLESQQEPDLGTNWTKLDVELLDRRARQTRQIVLELDDHCFDAVLCTGIERVRRPESLVNEVLRVLKPGGQVWAQVALNVPYRTEALQSETDFWRITPAGLRLLFEALDEIFCSVCLPGGSALRNTSFYYGLKPLD